MIKNDIDKLVQSGELPDRLQKALESIREEDTPETEAWRAEVETLTKTEGFREFVMAATKFHRAGHPLPDDEELLVRLLDHPSESVLQATLEHILDLKRRLDLNRGLAIKNRIKTIRQIAESPKTLALLDELETKV